MNRKSSVVISTILLIASLSQCSFARTSQYPYVPCPGIFQYMPSGNTNIGIITLKDVSFGKTAVSIELSQHGAFNTNNPGQLYLNFDKDKVFDYLSAGTPFTYRVDFPDPNIIPRVTSIRVNGLQICSGSPDSPPSTTMKLEHTLNAFSSSSFSGKSDSNFRGMRPSWPNFSQQSAPSQHRFPIQQNFPSPPRIPVQQNFPSLPRLPVEQNFPDRVQQNFPSYQQRPFQQNFNRPVQQSFTNHQQYPQSSELNSDMPEFLKYSPSFMQQMLLHQPKNFPPSSSFNPSSSYNPPNFNQPNYNPPTSYNDPSFDSRNFFQPPNSPEPYFNQQLPFQPEIPTPPSSYFEPPKSFNPNSITFESFLRPFDPQSYNQNALPSLGQSGMNIPRRREPEQSSSLTSNPITNYDANPRNPFLNKPDEIDTYQPPGSSGNARNPVPAAPTPIKPIVQPTPSSFTPAPGIDFRNVAATPTPTTPAAPPSPRTTTTVEPKTINPASFEYINSICGRENINNIDMQKLNVKGQVISKSRFPWIVAVFERMKKGYRFKCGGNLISTRTVVSAAHCFFDGFKIFEPEQIMVSMGRHNLTESLDSSDIDAEQIIYHPDYKPRLINFDADLAIVRLKQSVVFTVAIRPICMWQGAVDSRELEGVSGIIVGWGGDGRRNTTTVPTLVNATVVSEITCLRSNDVFISLTSNRTLCAGNLDGSGPCMGDSGNGLMIRNRNKWMLRGTVSAALGSPTQQCVLDQYAIYSDIAMFVEWIRSNMLL